MLGIQYPPLISVPERLFYSSSQCARTFQLCVPLLDSRPHQGSEEGSTSPLRATFNLRSSAADFSLARSNLPPLTDSSLCDWNAPCAHDMDVSMVGCVALTEAAKDKDTLEAGLGIPGARGPPVELQGEPSNPEGTGLTQRNAVEFTLVQSTCPEGPATPGCQPPRGNRSSSPREPHHLTHLMCGLQSSCLQRQIQLGPAALGSAFSSSAQEIWPLPGE